MLKGMLGEDVRTARRSYVVLALAFLISFGAVTFVTAQVPASAATHKATILQDWGGQQVTDSAARNVWGAFASWAVPTVTCSKTQSSEISIWVGIGGSHLNDTLYQTGIEATCSKPAKVGEASTPHYFGFAEIYIVGGTSNVPPKCLHGEEINSSHCWPVQPPLCQP